MEIDCWENISPEEQFMEDVRVIARSYIGNPILNDADAVAKDPILQLARELSMVERSNNN